MFLTDQCGTTRSEISGYKRKMTYNSNLKMISIVREQNILEGENTLLEPRTLLNGRRLITPDPSNPPVTSPTKFLKNDGICGPRHTSTAGITLHLTSK
jgi:hypothetical protein